MRAVKENSFVCSPTPQETLNGSLVENPNKASWPKVAPTEFVPTKYKSTSSIPRVLGRDNDTEKFPIVPSSIS